MFNNPQSCHKTQNHIASSLNITLSEWLNSIIEMNKNSYEKVGDPTNIEIKQGQKIERLNREIQELKNKLTIAEQQKVIELKSNFELRQLVADTPFSEILI